MRRDQALGARWGSAEASSAGGALKVCVCGIERRRHTGAMWRHRVLGAEVSSARGALKVCVTSSAGDALKVCGRIER